MKKGTLLFVYCFLFSVNCFSQPASWTSKGIGGGGALFSPSINPVNPSEYYIACDMSELFHTTNGGQTYSMVNFQQFQAGHQSKVAFTSTANLLYSISYGNVNQVGNPVKSTDNGVTWTALAGDPDPSSDTWTLDVDYANPQRIVLSQYGQIYFSSNGGTTFTSFHTNLSNGAGNVVGGVFFDGNNIYVGTNDGVIVSTNAGATWATVAISGIANGESIWSFAAGKVGNVVRFFCLTSLTGNLYVGVQGSDYNGFMAHVYSCDYGSGNWVQKMNGLTLGTDYPMFVGMATNDINTVYLGGSNSSSVPIMKKTTNAGALWTETFNSTGNQNIITGWSGQSGDRAWSYGECPFQISVCPQNSSDVVFGDYGFAHRTTTGGTTWSQAYIDPADQHPANANTPTNASYHSVGLENTTCWQVFWATATNMWSCYSDIRGIRSTDGGNAWSFNYTGTTANSTYRVAKGSNGTLYAGTSAIHDMYQSTRLMDAQLDGNDANTGRLIYSTNDGATWLLLHNFNHPVFWIALDPNNVNRAYASVIHYSGGTGQGGVYICNDLNNLATSTWTLLPTPFATEKHPASLFVLNDGKLIATYSGRRAPGFTASSGCFLYDPGTNSWTNKSDPGMLYWTKDVVVDPNDATQNTWYVSVFSGWGGPSSGLGGLYKTTNRGTSWTKLTGTMFDRVTSCTFNPSNANQIYLTTETQGLWMSSNINNVTPTFTLVANYPFRQPERVFFNPYNVNEIWVSSFGNGMKMGTLNTTGEIEFTNENSFDVYPNPSQGNFTVKVKVGNQKTEMKAFNEMGKEVGTWKLEAGENQIDMNSLSNGIYFLRMNNEVKKVVIQKK